MWISYITVSEDCDVRVLFISGKRDVEVFSIVWGKHLKRTVKCVYTGNTVFCNNL